MTCHFRTIAIIYVAQGGLSWLSETSCELELYLDPERQLYSRLGLARSVWRVWQMTTIYYYGSIKAQARQLPAALEGVEDDPLQMGGDFTVRYTQKREVEVEVHFIGWMEI